MIRFSALLPDLAKSSSGLRSVCGLPWHRVVTRSWRQKVLVGESQSCSDASLNLCSAIFDRCDLQKLH